MFAKSVKLEPTSRDAAQHPDSTWSRHVLGGGGVGALTRDEHDDIDYFMRSTYGVTLRDAVLVSAFDTLRRLVHVCGCRVAHPRVARVDDTTDPDPETTHYKMLTDPDHDTLHAVVRNGDAAVAVYRKSPIVVAHAEFARSHYDNVQLWDSDVGYAVLMFDTRNREPLDRVMIRKIERGESPDRKWLASVPVGGPVAAVLAATEGLDTEKINEEGYISSIVDIHSSPFLAPLATDSEDARVY